MITGLSSHAQKKDGCPVQWEIAGELPGINGNPSLGFAGPVAGILGEYLIVAGGANFPDALPWEGGKKKYHDSIFVYKKYGTQLELVTQNNKLPFPIAYTANCSTSSGILFAGGENEKGLSKNVRLIQKDDAGNFKFADLPDLPLALTNASAVCLNDQVYLAGGESASGTEDAFLKIDLKNIDRGWTRLPSIPIPISHTVMTGNEHSGSQYIFLAGGRRKNADGISTFYKTLYRYDISQQKWESLTELPFVMSAGTGISTNDGRILLFGGDRGQAFQETEKLISQINAEDDPAKKAELIRRKNEFQSNHPGFSREILIYDINKVTWTHEGCMPYETPVTTTAIVWDDLIILPTGEIRAGVRTPVILRGKLMSSKK